MIKALHFRNSHHFKSSIRSPWTPTSRSQYHFTILPPEPSTPFEYHQQCIYLKLISHMPNLERTFHSRILVIPVNNHCRDLTCSFEPRASNYPELPDLDSSNFPLHSRSASIENKLSQRIRRRLLFQCPSLNPTPTNREAYAFYLIGTFVKHCSRGFQRDSDIPQSCGLLLGKQAQVKTSIVVTVPVPKAFMVSIGS